MTLLPPSTIHSTLSISIFLSPSNTSPTANYPFLTPSCRAITENAWLISTADPHIQISRYLDFHSHHDRKHKISTAKTLLHRALNLPNTQAGNSRETARVCAALHSNGYPIKIAANVITKNARSPPPTPTPEELVGMFFKWAGPTNRRNFAVLPYINCITEPLKNPQGTRHQVTSRPVKTLQQHFPIPTFRPAEDDQMQRRL